MSPNRQAHGAFHRGRRAEAGIAASPAARWGPLGWTDVGPDGGATAWQAENRARRQLVTGGGDVELVEQGSYPALDVVADWPHRVGGHAGRVVEVPQPPHCSPGRDT
jgi:hypothetical protein